MSRLVSILIPAYNSASMVGDAIGSALAQTHPAVEVVVVDDGSTDATLQVARGYEGDGVRVIAQENAGACAARNRALAEARGEYVKFLDADDVLTPDALEVQLGAMRRADPSARVAPYGDMLLTDAGLSLRSQQPPSRDVGAGAPDLVERVVALLANNIQTSLPLHRRNWLLEAGGFRSHLPRAQEYDLHLRLAIAGVRFVHVPHVVAHIRHHASPDRITNTSPMLDDPGRHLQTLRQRREMIEAAVGRPLPAPIAQALARGLWVQMRRLVQAGQGAAATRYADEARQLDPSVRHAGSLFRVLSAVGGPVQAERLLIRARRLASLAGRPVS